MREPDRFTQPTWNEQVCARCGHVVRSTLAPRTCPACDLALATLAPSTTPAGFPPRTPPDVLAWLDAVIARAIKAHDDDSSAHDGESGSLERHVDIYHRDRSDD